MIYNKLVRDKIPNIIEARGESAITKVANDKEYWEKLQEKLQEEVNDFLEEPHEEELADILEVVHAICQYRSIDLEELEVMRVMKQEERGSFEKRIILREVR